MWCPQARRPTPPGSHSFEAPAAIHRFPAAAVGLLAGSCAVMEARTASACGPFIQAAAWCPRQLPPSPFPLIVQRLLVSCSRSSTRAVPVPSAGVCVSLPLIGRRYRMGIQRVVRFRARRRLLRRHYDRSLRDLRLCGRNTNRQIHGCCRIRCGGEPQGHGIRRLGTRRIDKRGVS